jgi:hypothetical protein
VSKINEVAEKNYEGIIFTADSTPLHRQVSMAEKKSLAEAGR